MLDLCAALPGAVEDYPFGESVAVFKVGGRMFALIPPAGNPGGVNLNATGAGLGAASPLPIGPSRYP